MAQPGLDPTTDKESCGSRALSSGFIDARGPRFPSILAEASSPRSRRAPQRTCRLYRNRLTTRPQGLCKGLLFFYIAPQSYRLTCRFHDAPARSLWRTHKHDAGSGRLTHIYQLCCKQSGEPIFECEYWGCEAADHASGGDHGEYDSIGCTESSSVSCSHSLFIGHLDSNLFPTGRSSACIR